MGQVYANISKSEKLQNLKLFWSQAFWIRDTQLILTMNYPKKNEIKKVIPARPLSRGKNSLF
jgi:hypothetical protein